MSLETTAHDIAGTEVLRSSICCVFLGWRYQSQTCIGQAAVYSHCKAFGGRERPGSDQEFHSPQRRHSGHNALLDFHELRTVQVVGPPEDWPCISEEAGRKQVYTVCFRIGRGECLVWFQADNCIAHNMSWRGMQRKRVSLSGNRETMAL